MKKAIIIALIFSILLGVGGWFFLGKSPQAESFNTIKPTRGDIENVVTATGRLQPRDYVDVGAQVSGQLKVLHVEVGDNVKQGDLLAEIDATVYLAKVDAIRAQLRNQRALMTDRQAQLALSKNNYQREKNLFDDNATSREAYESATANYQSAKAQITALQAQIEQTSSSLREEEANLEFASIYAPMDGTVVTIEARQGQTLNATQNAPTILRLADLSVMTVEAKVSEADVSKLYLNMSVYFTILGGEGRRWYGELSRIEPTPEVTNNVVLYNAKFDVPNENRILMTQMTTQVFFIVAKAENALQIPFASVRLDKTAALPPATSQQPVTMRQGQVTVLNAQGKPEQRNVAVGVTNRINAQILEGLKDSDRVVLESAKSSNNSNARMPMGPRIGR